MPRRCRDVDLDNRVQWRYRADESAVLLTEAEMPSTEQKASYSGWNPQAVERKVRLKGLQGSHHVH